MFGRLEALAKKRREIDAMEAEWLRELAEYDRTEEWRADGHLTCAAAVRSACRMNAGVARGHVELARKLRELPLVDAALGEGAISRQHAQVIASACTPERAEAIRGVELELVDRAVEHTPNELLGIVRYLCDSIDGDGGAASDDALHTREQWYMSPMLDGMLRIDALVDPESALVWTTAVRAAMEREYFAGDTRTPARRRAAAATSIVRGALDRGDLGETHGVRPHITQVIDLERANGASPDLVAIARGERRTDGMLSQATLERILCDCDVSRVIMAGPSEVLDVGRASRTATPAQWRALVARDKGCVACGAPPDHCQAHHKWDWYDGGPTDLANLELLCAAHHRAHHRGRARGPDG